MIWRIDRPALVLLAAMATAACGDHTVLTGPDAEAAVGQFQAQAANADIEDELRPLIFLDGARIDRPTKALLQSIEPQDIERIEVLKGCHAMAKFGEDGREGAIYVYTTAYEGPSVEFDDADQARVDACVEEGWLRRREEFVRNNGGIGWLPPSPAGTGGR